MCTTRVDCAQKTLLFLDPSNKAKPSSYNERPPGIGSFNSASTRHSEDNPFFGVCRLHHSGVRWCISILVICEMPSNRKKPSRTKQDPAPRASVTFPPDLYEILEAIAKSKKVSVAWVVRDAAEKYVADQWPLLGGSR